MTNSEHFMKFVSKQENGCWIWTGGLRDGKYGSYKHTKHSKTTMAHRTAYELFKGEIPKNYQIDHLCRVTKCVNPAHLEAVLPTENQRRGTVTHLTRSEVIEIKKQLKNGKTSRELGAYYGVNRATIYAIELGITWKDIEIPKEDSENASVR